MTSINRSNTDFPRAIPVFPDLEEFVLLASMTQMEAKEMADILAIDMIALRNHFSLEKWLRGDLEQERLLLWLKEAEILLSDLKAWSAVAKPERPTGYFRYSLDDEAYKPITQSISVNRRTPKKVKPVRKTVSDEGDFQESYQRNRHVYRKTTAKLNYEMLLEAGVSIKRADWIAENHATFNKRVLTSRQLARIKREEIQRRSALLKEQRAKALVDERRADLVRRMAVAAIRRQRDVKYSVETQSIGGAVAGVAALCGGVGALLIGKGVNNVANKTVSVLDEVTSMLKMFFKSIKEALLKVPEMIRNMIALAAIIYLWNKYPNKLVRGIIMSSIPILFAIKKFPGLVDVFRVDLSREGPEQQAGSDSFLASAIAVVIAGATGLKRGSFHLTELIKAIGAVPRSIKGIDAVINFCLEALQRVWDFARRFVKLPEVRFRKQLDIEIEAAIKEAYDLENQLLRRNEKTDLQCLYMKLMANYERLTGLAMMHRENKDLAAEINRVKGMVGTQLGPLRQVLGLGSGYRQEPASIMIEGKPGVGKTMQVPILIALLLKLSGLMPDIKAEETGKAFFTKADNTDYFDGYFGQPCYYIDDWCSILPTEDNPAALAELLAFYGSFTTMLNMAELDKKGMYPFTSSILLATTNAKNLEQIRAKQILLEPEALKRRVDIHIHVTVKPEYCLPGTEQLDYNKFIEESNKLAEEGKTGYERHPWHIWEYRDTTLDREVDMSIPPKPLIHAVARMVKCIKDKCVSHKGAMSHLAGVVNSDTPSTSILDHLNPPEQQAGDYLWTEGFLGVDPDNPRDFRFHPSWSNEAKEFRKKMRSEARKNFVISMWQKIFGFVSNVERTFGLNPLDAMAVSWAFGCVGGYVVMKAIKAIMKSIRSLFKGNDLVVAAPPVEQSNGPQPRAYKFKAQQQSIDSDPLWYRVYANTVKLIVVTDSGLVRPLGQLTFLADTMCVYPLHFDRVLRELIDNGEITTKSRLTLRGCMRSGITLKMNVGTFLSAKSIEHKDEDLCFRHFGRDFNPFRKISHFFLKESEIAKIGGRAVRLDTARVDHKGELLPFNDNITYESPTVAVHRGGMRTKDGQYYSRFLQYYAPTAKGDCGAPLCLINHNQFDCRLVAGIHVAGDTNRGHGFSTWVTAEQIADATSRFGIESVQPASLEESEWGDVTLESVNSAPFTSDGRVGQLTPLFLVSKPVSAPVRTKMEETHFGAQRYFKEAITTMKGQPPEDLVVMNLHPSKMEDALKPFAGDTFVPDTAIFKDGLYAGMKKFADSSIDMTRKVLTFDEAIRGDNQIGLKSLTRGTSVGYPLCAQGINNKKHFFGSGEELDLGKEEAIELARQVDSLLTVIKSGKRPLFVCRDFLKDETRKRGKSARLIAGTDLRYYTLCRMYFGAFVGALVRTHNETGVTLGMNPYSEWDELKRFLLTADPTGQNVWDGDFAGFDSSQVPALLWVILDYINSWYAMGGASEEDAKIRTILFMDLVSSRHLTSYRAQADTIVQWNKSLPSGHFLTSTVNSMLSMGLIASGFIATTGQVDFWSFCSAAVHGDDNLVATCDQFLPHFNQKTLSKFLKEHYDMTYTAGRKGEELTEAVGIDRVIFLQRIFSQKDGATVCPIRPESFLHSLYYTKTKDPLAQRKTILDNIENALEELSMHPEEHWDLVAPMLVAAKREYGETPKCDVTTSSHYLQRVKGRIPDYLL